MTELSRMAPALEVVAEGVLGRSGDHSVSYPADGHAGCLVVEDESWWFAHRNDVILELLARFPPGGLILDIGGGNGCVARAIEAAGHEVALLEPGLEGILAARARGVRLLVNATLEQAGFLPGSVPAVGLFDVVEHTPDDAAFLGRVREVLVEGGRAYLTVPAHRWLWSHADTLAGHHRRYTRASLRSALESSGFRVEFASYFFSYLLLPVLLARALPDRFRAAPRDRQRQSEREHRPAAWVRQLVQGVSCAERHSLRWRALPLGASVLAVAQKT